jgi:flagellar motor switch protein FliM
VERILTKEEISELLSAINSGDIDTESIPPQHEFSDSVAKLDLIQAALGTDRWQNINFDIITDSFSRNYGIALTNRLQRAVTMKRDSIQSIQFDPFLSSLNHNGAIGIIRLDPLLHGGMIIFESTLGYSIVEIMLGSAPGMEPLQLDRSLTPIEINIIKNIMQDVCPELEKSLKSFDDFTIKLLKVETDPRVINFVPAETDMLVIKFSAQIDTITGNLLLAIPYISLEPLREKLKNKGKDTDIAGSQGKSWNGIVKDEIYQMEIEVTARLEELSLPIREILDLQEGDIIDLDRNPASLLDVLVEDRPKYKSAAGIHNNKKAVRIIRKINPGE